MTLTVWRIPMDADLLEFADVIYAQLEDVFERLLSATDLPELADGIGADREAADCFAIPRRAISCP